MKILNIHGYKGNPINSAYSVLEKLGHDVHSPEMHYDNLSPQNILEELCGYIEKNNFEAVVGTSLGGFYAIMLCIKYDIPIILINPCLMPFLYLPRLGYNGDLTQYLSMLSEFINLKRCNVSTIVGECDDLIDSHDFTRTLLKNKRYYVATNGKHSGATLPLDDFFKKVL